MTVNPHVARAACVLAVYLTSAVASAEERPAPGDPAAEEAGAQGAGAQESAAAHAPAPASGAAAPAAQVPGGARTGAETEVARAEPPAAEAAHAAPVPAVARAESPPPARSGAGTAAEASGEAKPSIVRAVRRRGDALQLEVHGRVVVGIGLDERDAWARDLDMRDARIGLEARLPGILTVVEADLSARSLLRDAFVRLDGPAATRLQAGHFKAPFSARRLESSWRLPLTRRGLVDDYVVERNGIGGRRFGATGAVRPFGARLELAAGAFVGEASSDDEDERPRADDLAALVALRPRKGVELAATAYRASRDDGPAREAATAYLKLDLGPLEATVEGLAGHLRQGRFAAATAYVGWTFRPGSGALRVMPVVGAEVLELRGAVEGRGEAATAGAVLSWSDGLKVKVEGERARRPGDGPPANAVALQLATRF